MDIIRKIRSLFGWGSGFGSRGENRPLKLPRSEHEVEREQLEVEREQLMSEVDQLESQRERKKEEYFEARDAGNEIRADQLEGDIERIEAQISDDRRRLEEINEQLSFLNEILLLYDAREKLDSDYWEKYRDMSRTELRRAGIEERDEIEQQLETIAGGRKGLGSARERHTSNTSRMTGGQSETKESLEREYRARQAESDLGATEAVEENLKDIEVDVAEANIDEVVETYSDDENTERDENVDHA